MAFALKILIIVLPLSCWASSKNDLAFFKKRQVAFQEWLDKEKQRNQDSDAERAEIRRKRQAREDKTTAAREQFKRVEHSNRHLEAAYLQAQESKKQVSVKAQENFASNQKVLTNYKEKYVIPMKPKEYKLEESGVPVDKP